MNAWCLSGGSFKGAFQVGPIEREVDKGRLPDVICGVSVGAINGAMVACGRIDTLVAIWEGIRGHSRFMRPTWWKALVPGIKGQGLFSLKPTAELLDKYIHAKDLRCELEIGIVDRATGEYHQKTFNDGSSSKVLREWILASSSMSGIHEPIHMRVVGNKTLAVDGGHAHVLPLIPDGTTDLLAVFCRPLEIVDRPKSEIDQLGEAIGWALDTAFAQTTLADFARLMDWVSAPGRKASVFAPREPLGGMLDASRKANQARLKAGRRAIPTILTGGT